MDELIEIGKKAKKASGQLANLNTEQEEQSVDAGGGSTGKIYRYHSGGQCN